MRLISPFKDFYDCIQAHDEDRETLYIRKPEEITMKKWPFPACDFSKAFFRNSRFVPYYNNLKIIGFCGRIYPILSFTNLDGFTDVHCRTMEQVDKHFEATLKKDDLAMYKGEGRYAPKRRQKHRWGFHGFRNDFKKFFEQCVEKQDKYEDMFIEKRCPVFVATYDKSGYRDHHEITWNASLKQVDFFRVFKPEQAYQEILMFLNNLAVPMKPIPVHDDVTKAEIHGFDKFSFRKDATKSLKKKGAK